MMWSEMNQCERDFFQAAIEGEERGISDYIKDGGNLDVLFEYDEVGKNYSALMVASENGHMDCVRELLSFGADISHLSQEYIKAVVYASQQRDDQSLARLAACGMFGRREYGDVVEPYKEFVELVQQGNLEKAGSLLFDSNSSRFAGQISSIGLWDSALCFLILARCSRSFLDRVIENFPINVNGYNCRGFTPLISAILVGDLELLDWLIELGADINKVEDLMRHATDIECRWVHDLGIGATKQDSEDGSYFLSDKMLDSDGKSPIMFAVWTGKLNVVKRLLAVKNVDTNQSDSQQRTVLAHAVHTGSVDIVKVLLDHGVNVDWSDYQTGRTVLFDAVTANRELVLKQILQAVSDKKVEDKSGMTSLFHAANSGKARSLKVLLECCDFDINEPCKKKPHYTALMYAAQNKHDYCVRLLLDHGADICVRNADELTVFEVAAEFGDVTSMSILIDACQKGRSSGKVSSEQLQLCLDEAFLSAAQNKDVEVLRFMLKHCKNMNVTDCDGFTAVICAAMSGQSEVIRILVEHGADVNIKNCDDETALWHALDKDNMTSFELLVELGADVDYVSEGCQSLLVLAARKKDEGYLKILLDTGKALIDEVCKYSKMTPLTEAVMSRRMENIELLLEAGADVNRPDGRDSTPICYALRWPEALKMFLDAGVNVNVVNEDGETIWSPIMESYECLKMVLEHGAVFEVTESGLDKMGRRMLKSIHRESPVYLNQQWNIRCLMMLFNYGVFEWNWYVGDEIGEIHKIAFAAVNSDKDFPVTFLSEDEGGQMRVTSLLQEALLGNALGTVRYLLSNLFLTMEDYATLVSDSNFQSKMREKEDEDNVSEIVSIFNRVSSQPWRLETLSFLAISSSLSSSAFNQTLNKSRSELVNALALPEMLKSKLKFDNSIRKLCPSEWNSIDQLVGSEGEEIPSVMKPLLYSGGGQLDFSDCDEECRYCYGLGGVICG